MSHYRDIWSLRLRLSDMREEKPPIICDPRQWPREVTERFELSASPNILEGEKINQALWGFKNAPPTLVINAPNL
jgi:hypothetical protein